MVEKRKNHYINNSQLLEHLTRRREYVQGVIAKGEPKPPLDNYLGKAILDVANNLSYRPNFIAYTFRNDMISDAVENLVRAIDNFDPEKSKYPFAYMTKIAWQAFVRRIQLEATQQKIKGHIINEMMVDDLFDVQDIDQDGIAYKTHFIEYLKDNNFLNPDMTVKKELISDMETPVEPQGLEVFYDDGDLQNGQ